MRSLFTLFCCLLFFVVAIRAQGNLTPTNIADLIQNDIPTKVTGAEDVTVSYVFPDSALKSTHVPAFESENDNKPLIG